MQENSPLTGRRTYKPGNRKAAAALRYRIGEDPAPRLTAKGMGLIAEKIIEVAGKAGVPIHEDADLLALLMTLDVNDYIPPEMYIAVADVLAFIYRINKKLK